VQEIAFGFPEGNETSQPYPCNNTQNKFMVWRRDCSLVRAFLPAKSALVSRHEMSYVCGIFIELAQGMARMGRRQNKKPIPPPKQKSLFLLPSSPFDSPCMTIRGAASMKAVIWCGMMRWSVATSSCWPRE